MRREGETSAEQLARLWRSIHQCQVNAAVTDPESVATMLARAIESTAASRLGPSLASLTAAREARAQVREELLTLIKAIRSRWLQCPGIVVRGSGRALSQARNHFERALSTLMVLSDTPDTTGFLNALLREVDAWTRTADRIDPEAPRDACGVAQQLRERAIASLATPSCTVWLPGAYSGGAWGLGRRGRGSRFRRTCHAVVKAPTDQVRTCARPQRRASGRGAGLTRTSRMTRCRASC